jgi:hypothetical protein
MNLFEKALVAHVVADWLLQNDWMALNKSNLRHPAGWVHASIHGLLLGLVLGWVGGIVLGIVHLMIDAGGALDWWIRNFKRSERSPHAFLIRVWTDQALHIATIAAWVALACGSPVR